MNPAVRQLLLGGQWAPERLFRAGEQGAFYAPWDLSTMYQDSAGTTPGVVGQPVGRILDKSGRGNHATQATAASRPTLRQDASGYYYLEFDGIDDALSATFAITQPFDRIMAWQLISWTNLARVIGSPTVTEGRLLMTGTSGAPAVSMHNGVILSVGATPLGTTFVSTERFAGATSAGALNNGAYVNGDAGSNVVTGLTIGASLNAGVVSNPGNSRFYGGFMRAGAMSDTQVAQGRRFMASRSGATL